MIKKKKRQRKKKHKNTQEKLLHKHKISSERKLQLWKQTRLSFSCVGAKTITDKAYAVKVSS